MSKKTSCQCFTILVIAVFLLELPSISFFNGEIARLSSNSIKSSQISTEEIDIIVGTSQSYDIGEPIYAAVAGIRNAKADYIVPQSITVELVTNSSGKDFVIGTNHGEYTDNGDWSFVSGASVDRLNQYIYYTSFDAFGFDALLTLRVVMEWAAPWHQTLTATKDIAIGIGNWYNITSQLSGTRDKIKSSVLSTVNIGINFSITLIDNVQSTLSAISEIVAQMGELIDFAGVDPGLFNFYVLDFIGDSTHPGPLYDIVRNDLYSHLLDADRDTAMDARHDYIMNSIRDSVGVLVNKLGSNTNPAGGANYSYTFSFVRDLYEYDGPSSPYISGSWSVNSASRVVYSDKYGNNTGGSWTDAYNGGARNGPHDVSLEFLLEDMTGSHPRLKSPTAGKFNVSPPRKSIVINTGGPYFPVLNSWYAYYELSAADHPGFVNKTLGDIPTAVGNESETRQLFDDSNPMKNMRRLVLFGNNARPDLATAVLPGNNTDAFDPFTTYQYGGIQQFYDPGVPYLNMGWYLKKLGDGMKGKFLYWINVGGGKPFSKLTRDAHLGTAGKLVGDNHHEIMVQIQHDPCLTSVLSGNAFTQTSYDLKINFNRTAFQIIDGFAMITRDYSNYQIDAQPIGDTNTEYYKIDTGRWVDAFFNGTDLSERDGSLASANYITAAASTAAPWYSSKAPLCGFTFEDVYVYHRIGLLRDTPVANEYTWVPFLGPNRMVPIGWMPSQDIWWSVIGTSDMKMGLEYLYGGIFMAYKETVLKLKGLSVVPALLGMKTGIPADRLEYLFAQCTALDGAWNHVDLRRIDDIAQNIMTALTDKGTAAGGNIMEKPLAQAANYTNLALALVSKDEDKYSYVDSGLSTAGSDLTMGTIGDMIKDLIRTNIQPALGYLNQKVREMLQWMSSVKKRAFSTILAVGNSIFDGVETTVNNLMGLINTSVQNIGHGLEVVGGKITDIAIQTNQTIAHAIKATTTWTKDQINNIGNQVKAGATKLIDWVKGPVINTVIDGVNLLATGAQSVIQYISNLGQAIGQQVVTIGAAIGISMIAGGVIAGLLGSYGAGVGMAVTGAAIGIATVLAGDAISRATAEFTGADGMSTAVEKARKGTVEFLTDLRDNETITEAVCSTIQTVVDYSDDVVDLAGSAATGVENFAAGVAIDFGKDVKSFGSALKTGTTELLGGVTGALDNAYTWTQAGFEKLIQVNEEMVKSIIFAVQQSIKNTLSLVQLAVTILQQVSQIFENLVSKVNVAFNSIGDLFKTVTGFLLDLAGIGINIAVDFSKNVAAQLQAVENQIQQATGFYATSQSLFEQIRDARVAASLIEYASQTIGTTKEIFYKWVDVVKPLSVVKGGDTSFRVFQMGNVFAKKLYFVTVYQGKLVNVTAIKFTASRLPAGNESVPGGILQTIIPVYSEHADNGSAVPGLYYSSFQPSAVYNWYGSDKQHPYTIAAPVPGRYLARVDTNLTTKITDPHKGRQLDNFWMEETTLIAPQFSETAFPVIDILTAYTAPLVPGQSAPLRLAIKNEMYSKPVAGIEVSISTDTGFVIANRRVGSIVLPSDEEGTQIFDLSWTPSSNTPPGKYDLLVTVTQQNGDTTTKIIPVEIASTSIFSDFVGWIVGIISAIFGGLGLGLFISAKRKPAGLDSLFKGGRTPASLFSGAAFDMPPSCTADDAAAGRCSINGLALDCSADTGKCKIRA